MIAETLAAIKSAFATTPGINTPLDGRIHNFEAPQETGFPYLVYSISATSEDHALGGNNAYRFTVDMQIVDAEKKTHAQIAAIADAVLARLLVEEMPFPSAEYAYNIRLLNFSQSVADERPIATMTFSISVASQ